MYVVVRWWDLKQNDPAFKVPELPQERLPLHARQNFRMAVARVARKIDRKMSALRLTAASVLHISEEQERGRQAKLRRSQATAISPLGFQAPMHIRGCQALNSF